MSKTGTGTMRMVRMLLLILLPSCLIVVLPGCAVLGLAAYKLAGPPKVPAQYVPQQRPMLVLVENYQHQSSVHAHADVLAQMLSKEIAAQKIAPLVPLDRLHALRDERGTDFRTMSIAAIGRGVGAEQVLYVQLHQSDVAPMIGAGGGNGALVGQASASVKIVDVATGDALWPTDFTAEAGHPVAAGTQLGQGNGGGNAQDVRRHMFAQLSDQIAKLFYKWQPEEDAPEGFQS